MLTPAFSRAQGPSNPGSEKGKIIMRLLLLCIGLLLCSSAARAQLDQLEKRIGLGSESSLSQSKVASGLKDALHVGTDNAVKLTGKTDGYFGNEAIKILMPSNLRSVEKGLRVVGYGPKVDDFILSMNRSAEAAAPAARKIIVEKTMGENGVTRQYKELADQYQSIPFAKSQMFDINKYVVTKALDGLFYELAEQERQIRKDPAARTTNLLKEVFGKSRR